MFQIKKKRIGVVVLWLYKRFCIGLGKTCITFRTTLTLVCISKRIRLDMHTLPSWVGQKWDVKELELSNWHEVRKVSFEVLQGDGPH